MRGYWGGFDRRKLSEDIDWASTGVLMCGLGVDRQSTASGVAMAWWEDGGRIAGCPGSRVSCRREGYGVVAENADYDMMEGVCLHLLGDRALDVLKEVA